jgi:hypothetical protein
MQLVYKALDTADGTPAKDMSEATAPSKAASKGKRVNVMALTEQHSGMRLCTECDKLLPLDNFRPNVRTHLCIKHLRAQKMKTLLGTLNKRGFNSLRCRARQDMLMFGHRNVAIPRKLVTSLLTEDQMENFSTHCLIPRNPDQILSKDNIVVVTSFQRSYIVNHWRVTRDSAQYMRDLDFILGAPDHVTKNE